MAEEGVAFGRYQLLELLGAGGMGQVFRAYDTETRRVVAIKVLPPQMATNPVFQQRFRREAFAAAQLNEPHVVPIHNFGEIDRRLYVDMRLIEGRDLGSVLRDNERLDPARAAGIIEQVASALEAAHQVGLVHRDVKPSNILIGARDFVYLIDFGIARGVEDTGLTGAGETIGTLAYMAPERLSSGQVDPRSDVYSLACVLFECLTGRQPFPGRSAEQKIASHLLEPPPRPSELVPGLSEGWDRVIATGMAKDPAERYQRAMDLAGAAHQALGDIVGEIKTGPQSVTAPRVASPPLLTEFAVPPEQWTVRRPSLGSGGAPDQWPDSRRRWWRRALLISAAVAVLVVGATTVALVVTTHNQPGPAPPAAAPVSRPANSTSPYGEPATLMEGPTTGIAVDSKQNVNIALKDRVVQLPAGSTSVNTLPVSDGVHELRSIGVDGAGQVYVWGLAGNDVTNQVVRLATSASPQVTVPLANLRQVRAMAVNPGGDVYVAEYDTVVVLRSAGGQEEKTVINLTPIGIAVDTAGNVYLTQSGVGQAGLVVKLPIESPQRPSGTAKQEALPFHGVDDPAGIAVDTKGNVYVSDHRAGKVFKLEADTYQQTELPFGDLKAPGPLAVDEQGNVYVADASRVVKLPVR